MTVVFRNNIGAYTGKGSRLSSLEVDGNFHDLLLRLLTLEAAGSGVGIESITATAGSITITLTDDTTQGPFALPVATFNPRGEWLASTPYSRMDVVSVRALGTYLVLQTHTSESSFDPAEENSEGLFYQQIGGRAVGVPGAPYVYTASTTPTAGLLNLNAAVGSATILRVAKRTDDNADISDFLATWDDDGKGFVGIFDANTPTNFAYYNILSATDFTDYVQFTISHISSGGSLSAGAWVSVLFVPKASGPSATLLTVSASTRTLALTDRDKYLRCTHAGGCDITVPSDASVDFDVGDEIHFRQVHPNAPVRFLPEGSSVFIYGMAGCRDETADIGSVATLKKVGTDEWDLFGHLAEDVSA